jgi:hypothetical protein
MPRSLREWLPEDHLAWFVVDAVEEMDLDAFYADYRVDGHGAAAYEPSMMVALLLYAYATKQRSSRAIELHCRQDIAYRVISANRVPDHATIARFVGRHEGGTRRSVWLGARALREGWAREDRRRRDRRDQAAREREPRGERGLRADRPRDRRRGEGDRRGRGPPLRRGARRRAARAAAHARGPPALARRGQARARAREQGEDEPEPADEPPSMPRGRAKDQGRRGWHREARHQLDERRAREAKPIPRSRPARLAESKRRLEELEAERSANEAYEDYRARGRMRNGRRFGRAT